MRKYRVPGIVAILAVVAIIIAVPTFASGCGSDDTTYQGLMAQQSADRGQGTFDCDGDRDGGCIGGGTGRGAVDRDCDGSCDGADCIGDGDCTSAGAADCLGGGDCPGTVQESEPICF